jgi:hypothetical protein
MLFFEIILIIIVTPQHLPQMIHHTPQVRMLPLLHSIRPMMHALITIEHLLDLALPITATTIIPAIAILIRNIRAALFPGPIPHPAGNMPTPVILA